MKVIAAASPVVVQCPSCFRRLVLSHAVLPAWIDLAASMRGDIVDREDPTGVQVALALHVRDCSGGEDDDEPEEAGQ